MGEASIESDGIEVFVVYNGVRMAKRGQPNSPQAGTQVSLEPGFRVLDKDYPAKLVIERDGKIISQQHPRGNTKPEATDQRIVREKCVALSGGDVSLWQGAAAILAAAMQLHFF